MSGWTPEKRQQQAARAAAQHQDPAFRAKLYDPAVQQRRVASIAATMALPAVRLKLSAARRANPPLTRRDPWLAALPPDLLRTYRKLLRCYVGTKEARRQIDRIRAKEAAVDAVAPSQGGAE